jgi:2-(1,2-epoxy-1,2-dihydrophenyl)acetyl-CoA isomerase
MPDEPSELLMERHDALLIVTIDNQKVGNALSAAAAIRLADAFDDASTGTDGVRAVLLRSRGRHFCTGADISARRSGVDAPPTTGHMIRSLARGHHRAVAAVFHCRVPVVAAVQGAAQGFGLHLALATDFVVASDDATFKAPFSDRGFNVDSGGSWLLPRLVGLTRAKRMLYLADAVDATTAVDWGLVHQVVGREELEATAVALATRLAARPTQVLAATKRLLHDALLTDLEQALHAESMAVELTLRGNDFKEGMQAFFQKRPPEFTGT